MKFWEGREADGGNRKAGGKDNGKPGERDYTKGYYAAYILDLEGNNLECLYYQPLWLSEFYLSFSVIVVLEMREKTEVNRVIGALQYGPTVLGAAAVAAVAWWGGKAGWGL